MKKSNIVLAAFIIGISIINISCVQTDSIARIKGDGNIITSEKTLSPFEKLQLNGSVKVNFNARDEYRAVINIDSNLLEHVNIYTRGNTLTIGMKSGNYSITKYVVDIYCPNVVKVSLSGSGSFKMEDKILVPKFESEIIGSGQIHGNVECDNFSVSISGSGEMHGSVKCDDFSASIVGSGEIHETVKCNIFSASISGSGDIYANVECDKSSASIIGSGNINISGSSKDSEVNVSGSGSFKGNEFRTNNTDVNLVGSGNINIWVVDYLKADIAGSGKVTYRGNPKIDLSTSGSGQIKSE